MLIDNRLAEHARQWQRKPVLREIYTNLYRQMCALCVEGRTLEIGGGSGIFKEFLPEVISSDILFYPDLDLQADAERLPFAPASFGNIVMFDVLHHLETPLHFLREAERVLRPGGHLIMMEPAITPMSWPFYHFIHQEPVDMKADPLSVGEKKLQRDAFDSNQAIPTLLVTKFQERMASLVPNLVLREAQWVSYFAYPLSGGFKSWSLMPMMLLKPVLHLEKLVRPFVGRLMGFRLLIVYERTP